MDKKLTDSSPGSSVDRPRSPIDLDDTSNEATSPKSQLSSSNSLGSAFRQVKPIHATLPSTPGSKRSHPSPDSDHSTDTTAGGPKKEKHVGGPIKSSRRLLSPKNLINNLRFYVKKKD